MTTNLHVEEAVAVGVVVVLVDGDHVLVLGLEGHVEHHRVCLARAHDEVLLMPPTMLTMVMMMMMMMAIMMAMMMIVMMMANDDDDGDDLAALLLAVLFGDALEELDERRLGRVAVGGPVL